MDDEEYGNGKSRMGGQLATSDSEEHLDEDEPMTMKHMSAMKNNNGSNNNNLQIYYNNHQKKSSKKPFKMEVVDF